MNYWSIQSEEHEQRRDVSEVVSSFAPTNSPKIWMTINIFCLIWSFLLAVAIICEDTPMDRLTDDRNYMMWSLATCLIWTLEAGLIAWHCRHTGGKLTWAHLIELAIAIYFTAYSLGVVFKWLESDDGVVGQFFDVVVSVVAYAYQCWYILQPVEAPSSDDEATPTDRQVLV